MSDSALDPTTLHGPQGITEEDRQYAGTTYAEVRDAMLANPYQPVWGAEGAPPFPQFESTLGQVFRGFLPFGNKDLLKAAAARTVDSHADLRWGPDRKGFRRILHPNGIMLFGAWEITEDNPWSGYFRNGSRGLVISRLSPNGSNTTRGTNRSIGLVGKIYPTTDENESNRVVPANFYTQQNLGGATNSYLDQAEFRNAPDTNAFQGFVRLLTLARLGPTFGKTDEVPDIRQTHEVAELGKPQDQATIAPRFMKLTMTPGQTRVEGKNVDFRDEVYGLLYDYGDPTPKRELSFDLACSDDGEGKGLPVKRTVEIKNWRQIGRIRYHACCASFNGDHVSHFHHPNWRLDRNDPKTAVRKNGKA